MCTKCWLCFTRMFRQWHCLLERLASTHSRITGEPTWRVNPGMAVPSVWLGKWGASKLTSDAWSSDSNATCMHSVYFFHVRKGRLDLIFDLMIHFVLFTMQHFATFCNILLLFDKLWYSTFIAWMERPEFAALVKFSKESCCTPLPLQMRP